MENFSGAYEPCCTRIPCEVGDTITIAFMERKNNTVIGQFQTVIE
ncbi:hypothetical protein [Flavobacterium sp.]